MANRVEGVTEKLLECAMAEFLAGGYAGASLRTISENAGTTPRSVYTRYGDKEGLFAALTAQTAEEFKTMFLTYLDEYHKKPVSEQKALFHSREFDAEYHGYIGTILDFMYDHWREFRLLICCSEGSKYKNFIDEIVEIYEKYTLLYIEYTKNDVITSGRAKPLLIHLLSSSFVYGFFETVRHDMEKKDSAEYIEQLLTFYSRGWKNLFEPEG